MGPPVTTASPQPSGERRSQTSAGMLGHVAAAPAASERPASLAAIVMSTRAYISRTA